MTDFPAKPSVDPIAEGARARSHGRPKDACPYPLGSDARRAWLEGHDGVPSVPTHAAPSDDRPSKNR